MPPRPTARRVGHRGRAMYAGRVAALAAQYDAAVVPVGYATAAPPRTAVCSSSVMKRSSRVVTYDIPI
jgi:hypothetical protein